VRSKRYIGLQLPNKERINAAGLKLELTRKQDSIAGDAGTTAEPGDQPAFTMFVWLKVLRFMRFKDGYLDCQCV